MAKTSVRASVEHATTFAVAVFLAGMATAGCGPCARRSRPAPTYYVDRITVSERTLTGNPSLDLDADGLRRALTEALERSGRFRPTAPGEQPHAGASPLRCRAEVAFTRESESSAADAAGIRAEVGVQVELTRAVAAGPPKFDAPGLGRHAFDADDLARRRPAFRAALDQALSEAIEALLLQLAAAEKTDEQLIADLASTDARVRDYAVRALGDRKSAAAVPGLVERLSDPDTDVALRAIGALRGIGDARAVPALIEFTRSRETSLVVSVVDAIGSIGGREAEAYLFTVESGHPDEAVRKAAAWAATDLRRRRLQREQAGALRAPVKEHRR